MVWAPSYITDAQLAVYARTDPGKVAGYAAAASRAVDDFCNQQFGQVDEVTTFSYDTARVGRLPNGRFLVITDPIYRADGLVVEDDGTEITAGTSGYLLWPRNSNTATGVEPYAGVMLTDPPSGGYLDVTSRYFGWAAVPPGVVLATKIQGNRWAARGESPYGVAGSPSEGSEVKLSARLDVDARTPLGFPGGIRLRRPR